MTYISQRIALLSDLEALAIRAQASEQRHIQSIAAKDCVDLTNPNWDPVKAALMNLADLDIQNDLIPDIDPLLSELGLMGDYWMFREYFDRHAHGYCWPYTHL